MLSIAPVGHHVALVGDLHHLVPEYRGNFKLRAAVALVEFNRFARWHNADAAYLRRHRDIDLHVGEHDKLLDRLNLLSPNDAAESGRSVEKVENVALLAGLPAKRGATCAGERRGN